MKLVLNLIIMTLGIIKSSHPQMPAAGDIVINEVLFNPPTGGYDYVEGYNKSDRVIDLQELLIAHRNSTGDIADGKAVSRNSMNLSPGVYFVVTPNEKWLRQHYNVPPETIVCQASSMPSFADDEGTVVFLNSRDSTIIDELSYNEKWHFALISDPSGVALERINYNMPTQDENNWTSASSSSGYGTPGYKNSQFRDGLQGDDGITMPRLFSPDNDGVDDVELISFKMKEPGFTANTVIYDLSGRKVKYLIKNESVGLSALYKWDGLDERLQALPQGIYIIVTEIFNLQGKTKKFKNAVTLARR